MSALLVKDPPEGLCDWLKTEARCNRRSVNQQILICLEWCMRMFGDAQFRNPFVAVSHENRRLCGAELARKLSMLDAVISEDANSMKRDARNLRNSKGREFSYACFD